MSKKREILRLLDLGLSQRSIVMSAHVSPNRVSEMRQFCTQRNLAYSEALKLSDEEIDGEKKKEVKTFCVVRPDCPYIHEELKKKGVTLKSLHDEYVESCLETKQDYLKYTQFCNVYKEYVEDNKLTMHIERKPGERIEVDWSGGSVPIYD
ncbi:MAG: hypothetical protein IJI66_04210, partial [Erysipelotrichaceae bacterium]|nr:hypothetical protein [Erysipelotrichaceae bacterium]